MSSPYESGDPAIAAVFIDAPRSPVLRTLFDYWTAKRGPRLFPSRAEINPADIKPLLADVMLWSVEASGDPFLIRLVGDNIVRFVGADNRGRPATESMPPDAARMMIEILSQVVETKTPRFRFGKALWKPEKSYCDFEACFLPLSADGQNVNMILGGLKFDFESGRPIRAKGVEG